MKKLILALILTFASGIALANMQCGFKPFLPIGCTEAICICDASGCTWRFICG